MGRGRKPKAPPFVALTRKLLHSQAYKDLTNGELRLYLHVKSGYIPGNNGKIKLTYSSMKGVTGLSSKFAVGAALKGLIEKEWITRIQLGGLYRKPTTYALTWKYDTWDPEAMYEAKHNLGRKR